MRARAGGIVRYVLKDSLKYVPLYGYFLYKHGSVFIRRKVDAQSVISKQLQRLMQQKRPVSLSGKRIGGTRGAAPLKHVLTSSLLVATGPHPTNMFGTSVNVLSSTLSRHHAQLMTHSASPPPTLLSPFPPAVAVPVSRGHKVLTSQVSEWAAAGLHQGISPTATCAAAKSQGTAGVPSNNCKNRI